MGIFLEFIALLQNTLILVNLACFEYKKDSSKTTKPILDSSV